jgi:hypothetical protein
MSPIPPIPLHTFTGRTAAAFAVLLLMAQAWPYAIACALLAYILLVPYHRRHQRLQAKAAADFIKLKQDIHDRNERAASIRAQLPWLHNESKRREKADPDEAYKPRH